MKAIRRSQNLRQQTGAALRAALATGEMKQGETYSVPALAERFGISATPVREAVLDLVNDGLLVLLPNKGFQVINISAESLRYLTEVRLLLEIRVTVEIAKNINSASISKLRRLALDTQELAVLKDMLNFIEVDRAFHSGILELSGNPILVELADQLRSKARVYALPFILESGQLETSATEHVELIDAMENRDLSQVAKILEHHINYTIDAVSAMSVVNRVFRY